MNSKGFTVVELLASFTLTMVIVVFLFEIVLNLKDVYVESVLKNKVINNNSLIATSINKKLENKEIDFVLCETNVCSITYKDTSSDTLMINERSIDVGDNLYEMPEGTRLENALLESAVIKDDLSSDNAYFVLSYVVKGLKKDIKFNYVYTFKQAS